MKPNAAQAHRQDRCAGGSFSGFLRVIIFLLAGSKQFIHATEGFETEWP